MLRLLLFISFSFLCTVAQAEQSEKSRLMRSDELSHQAIFHDSSNLTFDEFIATYRSASLKERRYAEMYFLGVMDFTEGSTWCSYKQFKTITILEWVGPQLDKVDANGKKKRAAHVIGALLSSQFPCKDKK